MGRTIPRRSQGPLAGERGTIFKEAGCSVALGYPAPYAVGASSLGAQLVYRLWNEVPGLACSRFFVPDRGALPRPLTTLETRRPVREMHAVAFSIACEQELLNTVRLLEAADMEPLAERRAPTEPPVIIGGPLTLVDPALVAPLADVVVAGEGDHWVRLLGQALVEVDGDPVAFKAEVAARCPGVWVPSADHRPPPTGDLPEVIQPAYAATWSPKAELRNLFLVEASRGCMRRCAFCTMSRKAHCAPEYRVFPKESVLAAVPDGVEGVGLVGAAVSEHPDILDMVGTLVSDGRRVSLSSIRADRLTEPLARLLKKGGLRTLTVAADGPSERLRRAIHKGIRQEHLEGAAITARAAGFASLKVYAMVGLPGEEDADVEELAELLVGLTKGLRVSTTVQTFVPKPGTPLAGAEMAAIDVASRRLGLLKRRVQGRVRVLPTSPKWSWIDWKVAHAGAAAVQMAIRAHDLGGGFSAWRRAIEEAEEAR